MTPSVSVDAPGAAASLKGIAAQVSDAPTRPHFAERRPENEPPDRPRRDRRIAGAHRAVALARGDQRGQPIEQFVLPALNFRARLARQQIDLGGDRGDRPVMPDRLAHETSDLGEPHAGERHGVVKQRLQRAERLEIALPREILPPGAIIIQCRARDPDGARDRGEIGRRDPDAAKLRARFLQDRRASRRACGVAERLARRAPVDGPAHRLIRARSQAY